MVTRDFLYESTDAWITKLVNFYKYCGFHLPELTIASNVGVSMQLVRYHLKATSNASAAIRILMYTIHRTGPDTSLD